MCELLGSTSNALATVNFSLPKLAEHGAAAGTYTGMAGLMHWFQRTDAMGPYPGPILLKRETAEIEQDFLLLV